MKLSQLHPHPHPLPRFLNPYHHSTLPFTFSISFFSNSNFKFPTLCTTPSSTAHHPLPPNFSSSQLLHLLRRQNDQPSFIQTFQLASNHPNFNPELSFYNELLLHLTQTSSFDSITTVLKQMKSSGFVPKANSFATLIHGFSHFQDIELVLHIMENELGFKPDTKFYNLALNALVEDNKLKLVEMLHSKMVSEGVPLNVSTFNVLIKALCKARQLRPAILMLEDMANHGGLKPDEITFTTLMQGFIQEGDLNGALRITKQMLEYGCLLTHVSVNVLVNGFCEQGRIEEALRFIHGVCEEGFFPNQVNFSTLVKGLCRNGNVNAALEIVDFMTENRFGPDVYTYNSLISGMCRSGEFDKAIDILQQMVLRDCSPNTATYNTLISALCKENEIEAATELARILVTKGMLPTVCIFNTLIHGLCLTKNQEIALELFEDMKKNGCQPDEFTYSILIKSQCSERRLKEALMLLKEMELSGCVRNVVVYSTLIDGLCKSRRVEEAKEIFDQMELLGVSRNSVTYNTLIDGLCKNERVEEASQLMDQMIMEGLKPDKFTYNSLLTYFCRVGDIEKAADIVQTMKSNGCDRDIVTYSTLIGGLCKAGRPEVAIKLLGSIQMEGIVLTPRVYNPVIQALFTRKRTKEGMRLFREMIEKSDPPDAVTYKIVFRGLCNGGGPIQEAVDFTVEMLEKGIQPEFPSFSFLAERLCSLSMEETLIELINLVMERAKLSERETSMIRGFLKIRKFNDALANLGGILNRQNPRRY
ncbi:unnamed protein product [Lathyrus sativus]|nr:unnamed protein product [Lathyrus sativus]